MNRAKGCGFIEVPDASSRIWVLWSDKGLVRLDWTDADGSAQDAFGADAPPVSELPAIYAETLNAYLAGDPVDPSRLPVDLQGTEFQLQVWNALRSIPMGSVRSYAGIASDIGSPRAMRAVGAANGKNPVGIVVPCHRVVEQSRGLGGFSSGLPRKRFLLELEGVRVVNDQVQPGQLELL